LGVLFGTILAGFLIIVDRTFFRLISVGRCLAASLTRKIKVAEAQQAPGSH
jgi:hypothetical protein